MSNLKTILRYFLFSRIYFAPPYCIPWLTFQETGTRLGKVPDETWEARLGGNVRTNREHVEVVSFGSVICSQYFCCFVALTWSYFCKKSCQVSVVTNCTSQGNDVVDFVRNFVNFVFEVYELSASIQCSYSQVRSTLLNCILFKIIRYAE